MKVYFIGTGTMGCTNRANTSVLVDDMLFDAGCGTIKQLQRLDRTTEELKYVVITHFHADHFLDIPSLLIGRGIRGEIKEKLMIIGPKGIRQKVINLMVFTHADGNNNKYDHIEEKYNIEFIELEDGQNYQTPDFKLEAIALHHGSCIPALGYLLTKDQKTIAIAWDTTFCTNYEKMCQSAEYVLADVTAVKTKDAHIGLEEFLEDIKKYENTKFYVVHRGIYEIPKNTAAFFPEDGEILEI